MTDLEKDTPASAPAPASAVTLPLLVDYPWPNVPDSMYEVVEVMPYEGQIDARCRCVAPDGREDSWWYHVERLPGLTEEQRATLLALGQPAVAGAVAVIAQPDACARPVADLEPAVARIHTLIQDGHEANLRRQLAWLGITDGETFALQTLGAKRGEPSYLALCRSIDEAVRLSAEGALVAPNRWGKLEPISHQGIYVVANRMVGRIDEMFAPGSWQVMPEGVVTDARIASRRELYLDLDTQRRDEHGHPVDLPISATRVELRKTIQRAVEILSEIVVALVAISIDRASEVVALMMSGNGVQLWVALADLAESPELHALVKELLAIWGALYNSDVSHVDTAVHDAKRIGPLAGTVKRKGLKTALHRLVTFDGAPDPRRLTLLELQALVALYRRKLSEEQRALVAKTLGVRPPSPKSAPAGRGLDACNQVPIRDVAGRLGMDPNAPRCPSCESGGGSDVAFLDERNLLNCKHNRCASRPNRTPVDLVAKVAFGCDNISGTKGIARQVIGWFESNFGIGGRV